MNLYHVEEETNALLNSLMSTALMGAICSLYLDKYKPYYYFHKFS